MLVRCCRHGRVEIGGEIVLSPHVSSNLYTLVTGRLLDQNSSLSHLQGRDGCSLSARLRYLNDIRIAGSLGRKGKCGSGNLLTIAIQGLRGESGWRSADINSW